MRRLMEQAGETANLAILDGTEAVFIDQVQCRETMRTIVRLGSRVPLHASGVGKAIFAALPDEQIEAILKVKGLPRITENTITAPGDDVGERARDPAARLLVRRREHLIRTRCVASPIYDEHAEVLGAISLAGSRLAPARHAHQAAGTGGRAHRRGHHEEARRPLAASALARGARFASRARDEVIGHLAARTSSSHIPRPPGFHLSAWLRHIADQGSVEDARREAGWIPTPDAVRKHRSSAMRPKVRGAFHFVAHNVKATSRSGVRTTGRGSRPGDQSIVHRFRCRPDDSPTP
ncbi:MAG: hypothetical protein IPG84_14540 [Betaproteobacteria bacterium]|nr:hypothetical protein [Betaproteobacteria bacterium]